jgi:UDPglucose--hexose-1-phosphate uridylyltransferase
MSGPNELRQNVLTGRWTAVAPTRGERPHQQAAPGGTRSQNGTCPFCPGSEHELAAVLLEVGSNGAGWRIRVVPNRYPAFTNDAARGEWVDAQLADPKRVAGSLTLSSDVPVRLVGALPAVGYQEVIIETAKHDLDLADMTPAELTEVVDVYHARYLAVSESAPHCRVFLFRNRGSAAGTSIEHPHAQLIATTAIPPEVRVREIRMLAFHNDRGHCLLCTLPEVEPDWDQRLVFQNEHYLAFVPLAAETECELWLVPRRHQAEFGETSPEERAALGSAIGELLRMLRDRAGNPAYNLMIHSPRRSRSGSQAFHWFLQIRPRSAQSAGFELASGISINVSSPERDARVLRGEEKRGTHSGAWPQRP